MMLRVSVLMRAVPANLSSRPTVRRASVLMVLRRSGRLSDTTVRHAIAMKPTAYTTLQALSTVRRASVLMRVVPTGLLNQYTVRRACASRHRVPTSRRSYVENVSGAPRRKYSSRWRELQTTSVRIATTTTRRGRASSTVRVRGQVPLPSLSATVLVMYGCSNTSTAQDGNSPLGTRTSHIAILQLRHGTQVVRLLSTSTSRQDTVIIRRLSPYIHYGTRHHLHIWGMTYS